MSFFYGLFVVGRLKGKENKFGWLVAASSSEMSGFYGQQKCKIANINMAFVCAFWHFQVIFVVGCARADETSLLMLTMVGEQKR